MGFDWPPYAYVPTRNARHPKGAFDGLIASVGPDVPTAALHHTAAFRAGMAYLKAGYYWEAHEVFEPIWMAAPPGSAERLVAQILIQIANARLKHAMQRPKAAARLEQIVRDLLVLCPAAGALGLTRAALGRLAET